MPKDKCQVCGKPSTGRFCYTHLGAVLDASRTLYEQSPLAWKTQVDNANHPTEEPNGTPISAQPIPSN